MQDNIGLGCYRRWRKDVGFPTKRVSWEKRTSEKFILDEQKGFTTTVRSSRDDDEDLKVIS